MSDYMTFPPDHPPDAAWDSTHSYTPADPHPSRVKNALAHSIPHPIIHVDFETITLALDKEEYRTRRAARWTFEATVLVVRFANWLLSHLTK